MRERTAAAEASIAAAHSVGVPASATADARATPDADAAPPAEPPADPPRSRRYVSQRPYAPKAAARSKNRSLRFIDMMSNNERQTYAKGEALFREGEEANNMYASRPACLLNDLGEVVLLTTAGTGSH